MNEKKEFILIYYKEMDNKFLKLQLNRNIWIALIAQNKFIEAINVFKTNIDELQQIKSQALKKKIPEEIKIQTSILVSSLEKKREEFIKKSDYHNALICCKYIYDYASENETNITNYLTCIEKLEQYDLQLELAKYLYKKTKTKENSKILSQAYAKNSQYDKAIAYYNEYIKLSGKKKLDAGDNNTIGCHYFNKYNNHNEEPSAAENSLKYFKQALQEFPTNKAYLKNTIMAAIKCKDYGIEKELWEKYIKLGYMDVEDEFIYSVSCLRHGNLPEWGKYYNSRFRKKNGATYPKTNKPEWTGNEDISNSTLLVHYEQGYGDSILMYGYMPRLVKLAKKVIFYIQNNAYELVKNNKFGVEIQCPNTIELKSLNFDYIIPAMSLPAALKTNLSNISVLGGYIETDKKLVQEYKNKYFNNNKYKIGISFGGTSLNMTRNISVEKLVPLENIDNVQLYCFTKDVDENKLKCFKKNNVINIVKEFDNFAQTAAAMENMDLIVTTDNCILNLAGAIGKRTIALYNYHYEYRWYNLTGKDSGWYKSVIPIVNNKYNDWDLSVKKAVKLIEELRS